MSKRKLDPYTLRAVGRELTDLGRSFYSSPPALAEFTRLDRIRGDIVSAWGRVYLGRARRLVRAESKSRSLESATRKKAAK